ncbi:MAG: hypothetical protein ACERKN_16115 [Velocimicrobium sp.]
MNLKVFYEKHNNTTLFTEAYSCENKEELEALAKANNVELSSEELEKLLSIMKNKTVELSDDELDEVAGGKDDGLASLYLTALCPGVRNSSNEACAGKCRDYVQWLSNQADSKPFMACRYIRS